MEKNVTLKLDDALLKKCRQLAVEKERSLSQWVKDLMRQAISKDARYARAKKRALKRLRVGFALGGRPLSREEVHER